MKKCSMLFLLCAHSILFSEALNSESLLGSCWKRNIDHHSYVGVHRPCQRLRGGYGDSVAKPVPQSPGKVQREVATKWSPTLDEDALAEASSCSPNVCKAYVQLAIYIGALLVIGGLLAGLSVVLVTVVLEDLYYVLATMRGTHLEENTSNASDSYWKLLFDRRLLGLRAAQLLDWTRNAAHMGVRSAANQLYRRQTLILRPVVYIFLGYAFSQWLAGNAEPRTPASKNKFLKIDRMTAVFLQTAIKYSTMSLIITYVLLALGVPVHYFNSLLASAGIAVGIASQKVSRSSYYTHTHTHTHTHILLHT